jgi:hypothetical protein
MNVRTLPMAAGWTWLREGLALYRRQAFAFTALVILYSMALMLLASVPVLGLPLAALLVPFGTLGITAAGRDAERNVMPLPSLLVSGLKPGPVRTALLKLGGLHAALVVVLAIVTSFFARDELARWNVVDGQLDPASVAANVPWDAIGLAAVLYVPILMMTWFAPQLVAWHRQPVAKALFFSFFACWRNRAPLLLLGILLAGLIVALSFLSSQLLALLGASAPLVSLLFAPIALVLTSIAYSTQYPIYRAVVAPEGPDPRTTAIADR